MRALRWVLATAVVMVTAGGAVAAAPAAGNACNGTPVYAGNGWLGVVVPGMETITQLRSVTYAPDRMYVTDGSRKLERTDDGGCTWTDISPAAPALGGAVPQAVHITSISAPSTANSASYLYVGADISATDKLPVSLPTQPYVFVSDDGGTPTLVRNSSNGLPDLGKVKEVAAADLPARTVYALITDAGSNSGVWASTDAGQHWNGPLSTDTSLSGLRVDPTVANHIYAVKPGVGVVLSSDGGRSFRPLAHTSSDVQSFGAAAGSGSLQLVEGHAASGRLDLSTDAGTTWRAIPLPHPARSVAVGPVVPVAVAYDDKRLSIIGVHGGKVTRLDQTPTTTMLQPGSAQVSAPTALASVTGLSRDGHAVLRLIYNVIVATVQKPSLTPIRLLPSGPLRQFPSTLSSATKTLRLRPGASRDVPYSLLMPRTPSPVDLMFLVDTTLSTDQTIDGVRQGLQTVVNELLATGLDVQFGVGDFKDYPYWATGGGDDTDYPYRLDRAIGPVNGELQRALSRLKAGGGGDLPESDLAALYYSTTGVAERIDHRVVVRPGQGAGYRNDSLRLALLATDSSFHRENDYPGPSFGETVATLNAHGVHQIGLAVQTTDSNGNPIKGQYDGLPDERRMAYATHSIAPRGGVDCDGNGTTDIAAGSPLVCTITKPQQQQLPAPVPADVSKQLQPPPPPLHLAPLVVQLAESIPDYKAVGLTVTGAPSRVAQSLSAAPHVNVRVDNSLGFTIRYTCPTSHAAHSWPVTVTAHAGLRTLATTHTVLTCSPAPLPLAAVVPPAAAVVVSRAAGGVTPPNPPANVNANFNPNPAVNPNAGFAQQDEEQPQLALADADQGTADDTTLAMSRHRTSESDALFVGAAGLMAVAAGAVAVRRRWAGAWTS